MPVYRRGSAGAPAGFHSPPSVQQQVQQGDQHLRAGETSEAIVAYRLALQRDPRDSGVLAGLASAYRTKGQAAAAQVYVERAADIAYQRGLAALQAHRPEEAAADFQVTLKAMPGHVLALNRLADISAASGDEARAVAYLEESARSNPEFADTYVRLGALHQAGGRLAEAEEACRHARAANISATPAYIGLGEIALHRQRWTQAAESFGTALLIQPGSEAARAGLRTAQEHL